MTHFWNHTLREGIGQRRTLHHFVSLRYIEADQPAPYPIDLVSDQSPESKEDQPVKMSSQTCSGVSVVSGVVVHPRLLADV